MRRSRLKHSGRFVIENMLDSTIRLRIEPWADEYDLPSGTRGTVISSGPSQVDVLIQIESGVVTVWEESAGNTIADVAVEPVRN
jgi:hypothetical protein